MNNHENNYFEPDTPEMIDDDDDWDDTSCSEHEEEAYIKNIRQNLGQFKTFCPAAAMADAIGGAFTAHFVQDICHEEQSHVRHFIRRGTCYIAIEPFLEKLKAGLSFEDAPDLLR